MDIYVRRIDWQCINKQISFTKNILNYFFDGKPNQAEINCIGEVSKKNLKVRLLLATDPRFSNDMQEILKAECEGKLQENDIMMIKKITKDDFVVSLLTQNSELYNVLNKLFKKDDRHLLLLHNNADISIQREAPEIPYYRNRIVFGAPGTGKSYKLKQDSRIFKEKNCIRVTFYPGYSFQQFVGTYKPQMEDRNIVYKYTPGPFVKTFINSIKYPSENHLLLIEEINRATVAATFGDVFQLLDRDERGESEYPILIPEDLKAYLNECNINLEYLKIPSNMYIWATMNSADQGVQPLDSAFKRRWNFEYLSINGQNENKESINEIDNISFFVKPNSTKKIKWGSFRNTLNEFLINECRVSEDKCIGPFFFERNILENSEKNSTEFFNCFKNKLLMYLYEDVVRINPQNLFKNASSYSNLCLLYDEEGLECFNCKFNI